jgi:hypothetical protein
MSTLSSEQRIQVVQMNSKKDTGTFLNVTDAAITLEEKSGEQTIQKPNVHIVKPMKNEHRLRNTLIGAPTDAGVGAGIGAASYRPCMTPPQAAFFSCLDFGRGPQAAIGALVGLVGGAVTGALWPSHKIIYRVNGSALDFAPLRDSTGISLIAMCGLLGLGNHRGHILRRTA